MVIVYTLLVAVAYQLAGSVREDYQPYDTRRGDVAAQLMLSRGHYTLEDLRKMARELGLDL